MREQRFLEVLLVKHKPRTLHMPDSSGNPCAEDPPVLKSHPLPSTGSLAIWELTRCSFQSTLSPPVTEGLSSAGHSSSSPTATNTSRSTPAERRQGESGFFTKKFILYVQVLLVLVTASIAKKSFNEYFLKDGYDIVYAYSNIFVYYTLYTTLQ